ncbi:MAG: N-acyl homoserine lactonase family protein [Pseudomonadota bacterium]
MKDWQDCFNRPLALKLYVIHTGNVHMAGKIHYNPKSPDFRSRPDDKRFNPVLTYLVEHPLKGYILLDTGIHPSFALHRTGNFGWLLGRIVQIKTSNGLDVPSQLKRIGLSVKEITTVILSHLHLDHLGGLPLLAHNDTLVVHADTKELAIARSSLGLLKGYIGKHIRGVTVTEFDYSMSLPPFDRVCDLFGDQSIWVVGTPGHTPGHVSVILNMHQGPFLLTFDAAHRASNIEDMIPPKGDYEQGLKSLKSIKSFLKEFPTARVIYSHDPDQISRLKTLPEYYE